MSTHRTFLAGPAGTGKTTQAVDHLRTLLQSGAQAEGILVIAPQRSLLKPYQDLLRRADLPAGNEIETLTTGGLAKRSVDLLWRLFFPPGRSASYLSDVGDCAIHMGHVVQPFITERYYFEEVRLADERI
jgi:hypothetical protein